MALMFSKLLEFKLFSQLGSQTSNMLAILSKLIIAVKNEGSYVKS